MIMTPHQSKTATGKSRSGRITTHVLDTLTGRPAAGLTLELSRSGDTGWAPLGRFSTGEDGRCATPLLEGRAMQAGQYEILFHVAAWRTGAPGFYDAIPIRFTVADPQAHHHVPLILSPFGYSTYRGS